MHKGHILTDRNFSPFLRQKSWNFLFLLLNMLWLVRESGHTLSKLEIKVSTCKDQINFWIFLQKMSSTFFSSTSFCSILYFILCFTCARINCRSNSRGTIFVLHLSFKLHMFVLHVRVQFQICFVCACAFLTSVLLCRWYRALNALKAMHTMQKLTFPETVPGKDCNYQKYLSTINQIFVFGQI